MESSSVHKVRYQGYHHSHFWYKQAYRFIFHFITFQSQSQCKMSFLMLSLPILLSSVADSHNLWGMPARITLQGRSTQGKGDGRDEYDLCTIFIRYFKHIILFLLFFQFFNNQSALLSPCSLLFLSTQLSVLRVNKSVFPIWLQSRSDKCSQNKNSAETVGP